MSELVRVYRNLHNGKLSVQRYTKGKGWRVWTHVNTISLDGVTFKVSEKARQRVVTTKRKTVHAWVYGRVITHDAADWHMLETLGSAQRVGYNPYKYTSFVMKRSGERIDTAYAAQVNADGSILVVL